MCIIQGKIEEVKATNIFVAPLQDGRQLSVYCNKVSLKDQAGSMILPFPVGKCEFFDLSKYKDLFKDLNRLCFPQAKSRGMKSLSYSKNSLSQNYLEVHQVGSYAASIVPGLEDFPRIRPDIFKIDPRVFKFLREMYSVGYSFLVCKLDKTKEYHPFGYIHEKLPSKQIFIPTIHWHEHEPYQKSGWMKFGSGTSVSSSLYDQEESKREENHVDWDHFIYSLNRPLEVCPREFETRQYDFDEKEDDEMLVPSVNSSVFRSITLDFEKLPRNMEPASRVYAYRIENYHRNHDLVTCV